jgi:chromosome segregation ATPase
VERERRGLELALYQRKIQANRAEIEHFRTEKLKRLDERQHMINQIEDKKLIGHNQGDQIIELRSHIKKLEVRYSNLVKLRADLELNFSSA